MSRSPDELLVDPATIAQLRQTLDLAMRRELLDTFDESSVRCSREIAEAARRGDRVELARVAHLLKGSSATIGAAYLSRCCERLEALVRQDGSMPGRSMLQALDLAVEESGVALREQLI
jgi:HPt (histidine-containing phosphotransfer) domain-containing protein